ncbi:MAG: Tex-like N-terminal domain-containing protein [Planctomycetota bacterium]
MVPEPILRRLEAEFDSPPESIRATAELLFDGATPEFVALFRRDESGDLGEERILAISERLSLLRELDTRRTTIVEHAEQAHANAGEERPPALSMDELRSLLDHSVDQDLYDDVEHFLRPHEHKAEAAAHALGLDPLLERILTFDLGDKSLADHANEFVDASKNLNTSDEVLGQVILALAERFGEDPRLRATVRQELGRGILEAKPTGKVAAAASASRSETSKPAKSRSSEAPTGESTGADSPNEDAPTEDPRIEVAPTEPPMSEGSADATQPAESPADSSEQETTPAPEQNSGDEDSAAKNPGGEAAANDAPAEASSSAGSQAEGEEEEEEEAASSDSSNGATPDAGAQSPGTPSAEIPSKEIPSAEAQSTEAPSAEAPSAEAQSAEGPSSDASSAATLDTEGLSPEASNPEGSSAEDPSGPAPAGEAPAAASRPAEPAQKKKPREKSRSKKKGKSQGHGRYAELMGLEEPVRRIPANRMLALRRAERDGALTLRLKLEPGKELELFRRRFSKDVDTNSQIGQFLDLVYGHAYDRFVHPSCEKVVRQRAKEKADRETVRSFARSLRAQLMSPGLPESVCAALRVSGKSAWYVTLGPDGTPRRKLNPNVPTDEEGRGQLAQAIADAIKEDAPKGLAIPHGKRERAAARLADDVLARLEPEQRPIIVPLDQTASVVWATSANARRRHQNSDNGMRTTLSLARRLRDPLLELIRVEPRGLGLGQNLVDVHQGLLRRQLDQTASTCLARIGVDVNRSDQGLLARLPGVSQHLAKAIVQHRSNHGPFTTLKGLQEIVDLDEPTWRHIVGFLRIHGGQEVLDATTIHPDDYDIVSHIAGREGCTSDELFGRQIPRVTPEECGPDVGLKRLLDILDALRRGTTDPRGVIEDLNNEGVKTFADLRVDQPLRGRVTNLAEFGAFVDLGIGQDGLIHLSQIPGAKLRDPERLLRVGEVVTVYVVQLDERAKKIGLSMFQPRHVAEGRAPTLGERMGQGGSRRGGGGGRGRGRGRDRDRDENAAQTRAARVPEGRRGTMRRGPKPKHAEGGGGGFGGDRDDRRSGGRRGPKGAPRVITVESEQESKEVRGHKGELRSLSSLKGLLQKNDDESSKD